MKQEKCPMCSQSATLPDSAIRDSKVIQWVQKQIERIDSALEKLRGEKCNTANMIGHSIAYDEGIECHACHEFYEAEKYALECQALRDEIRNIKNSEAKNEN